MNRTDAHGPILVVDDETFQRDRRPECIRGWRGSDTRNRCVGVDLRRGSAGDRFGNADVTVVPRTERVGTDGKNGYDQFRSAIRHGNRARYGRAVEERDGTAGCANTRNLPLINAASSISSRLAFDEAKLAWELNFFFEHYFGSLRHETLSHGEAAELKVELNDIAAELSARPRVLCHRDFHYILYQILLLSYIYHDWL